MPDMYIMAGCNGAGKTTAGYTIIYENLSCDNFINADNIALALSPFNPESVAFVAGRMMLNCIRELMEIQADFAFETTLSTLSYISLINEAHARGYKVKIIYLWLSSVEIAVQRVMKRVKKGGHHIPADVIERRYYRGLRNLYKLYMPVCEEWLLINNMDLSPELIARGGPTDTEIFNKYIWNTMLAQQDQGKNGSLSSDSAFAVHVMAGLRKALRKMTEEGALKGESLVIGNLEGKVQTLQAAELLKTLSQE